jgi:hypothetical protein
MGFCGTILLPAALGISVEAVRFVIILLRALLDEVDPVLDRVDVTVGRVNTARLLDMCGNHG